MKKVLLVNWDSYPNFVFGGVYVWEKLLIENLKEYKFSIVNVLSNSNCVGEYKLPENVEKVFEVPIFGSYRYEEFNESNNSLNLKIARTKESVIKDDFIPIFKEFLNSIITDKNEPLNFHRAVYKLHKFLLKYDFKKCVEHPIVWDTFLEKLNSDPLYAKMQLKEALVAFNFFQKYMQIFSIDVPRVDLVHCSQAWLPASIAIIMKMKYGCPVIVTEHGVTLKELMLYLNNLVQDVPTSVLWNNIATNIVQSIYSIADVLAPVCYANGRWEETLGVDSSKINVIYNGVNTSRFKPEKRKNSRPTVVYVGRVDAWKDVVNLIYAINHAKERIPDIQCLIYGAANDAEYASKCLETVDELKLRRFVKFMGKTSRPEEAYNQADVVVSCSVAEGFPLWVIEAMACGKAIVSTSVGGIREVLEDHGTLVKTANSYDLADALVSLLQNQNMRKKFGESSIEKIKSQFTLEHMVSQYRALYDNFTSPKKSVSLKVPRKGDKK